MIQKIQEVINKRGNELNKEWKTIFDIFYIYILNINEVKDYRNPIKNQLIELLRTLYINGEYGEGKESFLAFYDSLKHIVNDRYMNAVAVKNLQKTDPAAFTSKLIKLISLNISKEQEEYCKTCELLNCLEELYNNESNKDKVMAFEDVFISEMNKYFESLIINCKKRVFALLQSIALKTEKDENFEIIMSIFEDYLVKLQKKPIRTKEETETKGKSLSGTVLKYILVLFKKYYFEYPPKRLIKVIKTLLYSLRTSNEQISLSILKILEHFTFDKNWYLLFKPWKTPSYLCGWNSDQHTLHVKSFMKLLINFIESNTNIELILSALDSTINLGRSHYGIYDFSLTDLLIKFLKDFVKEGNLDCTLRTVETLYLTILQQDLLKKDNECKEAITICKTFIQLLKECKELFKVTSEESRKLKAKQVNFKGQVLNGKNQVNKYKKLIKFLMFSITSAFYAYGDNVFIDEYIDILQGYGTDINLVEIFAKDIQESIAGIFYSGLASKINPKNLLSLTLSVGLRNLYLSNDYHIPTLLNYLKTKEEFPSRAHNKSNSMVIRTDEPFIISSVVSHSSGEIKNPNRQYIDEFFNYQQDDNVVMQLLVENVVHLFGLIEDKAEILHYLNEVIRTEMEIRNSPIRKQMMVLSELISWISTTTLSRIIPHKPPKTEGKLFIIGDGIVQIIYKGNSCTILVRNAGYEVMQTIEIRNKPETTIKDLKDNYLILKNLNTEALKEEESNIEVNVKFEQLLKMLPVSLKSGITNSNSIPIELNEGINSLIEELDNTCTYNEHSIGVIYIAEECKNVIEEVYKPVSCSDRFLSFISELGIFVLENSRYKLEWRDLTTHVEFYTNARNLIEDNKELMTKINVNSVIVLWNEKGEDCLEDLMKLSSTRFYIVIEPLPTDFNVVYVIDGKKQGIRRYGPILSHTVIHKTFLARAVLRASIVTDIKARKKTCTSTLILRQTIIDKTKLLLNPS